MKKTFFVPVALMLFSLSASAQNNSTAAPAQKTTTKVESQGPVTKTVVNESDARISRYRAMTKEDLQKHLERYEAKLAANQNATEAAKAELNKLIGEIKGVLAEKK
jgi:peptidoglycan hydrolase CwlO-like protein